MLQATSKLNLLENLTVLSLYTLRDAGLVWYLGVRTVFAWSMNTSGIQILAAMLGLRVTKEPMASVESMCRGMGRILGSWPGWLAAPHLPVEAQGGLQAHVLLLLRHVEHVPQVDAGPDEEGRMVAALRCGAVGGGVGALLAQGQAGPSH